MEFIVALLVAAAFAVFVVRRFKRNDHDVDYGGDPNPPNPRDNNDPPRAQP